jgi:outer membrane protein assembly factor BamB
MSTGWPPPGEAGATSMRRASWRPVACETPTATGILSMMKSHSIFMCWLGMTVSLGGSSAFARDWPQWGGSDGRNMVSNEKPLPDSFVPGERKSAPSGIDLATTKNVKWVARLGNYAYGNPTVADGRVFVGTDCQTLSPEVRNSTGACGMVKCLDEATGKLLWQLIVPKRTDLEPGVYFNHQELGVCSSPTVDGDRVYVVTSADEVVCLDVHGQTNPAAPRPTEAGSPPTDAKVIWRYDLVNQLRVSPHDSASCSVVIHGDVLYVGTSNGVDKSHEKVVSPEAPALVALDKRTGRLLATENEHISRRLFHCQWSPPSLGKVGDKTLLFFGGADGVCYAFETLDSIPEKPVHLRKVWSYDCNPPSYRFRDGKPIHYTDGDRRRRRSPNKDDGLYVGPSEIIGTPVFHNNRVYVAIGQDPTHGRGRGMLHCIDATRTGDITETGRIWSYDGIDRTIASPTIADGLVYIPDIAGRVHCLNADTGKRYWVYETGDQIWGSILAADGKLFFGAKRDFLVMAAGKEAKVLSRVQLGSATYSTPIVANGVLYVASQQYLWAVQGRPEKD